MRVPYPHVERSVYVARPALVVSHRPLGPDNLLLWTAMITNAARATWPGDILIPEAETLGLLIPSKLRLAKLSTVEAGAATLLGRLPPAILRQVQDTLRTYLGL